MHTCSDILWFEPVRQASRQLPVVLGRFCLDAKRHLLELVLQMNLFSV